MINFNINNEFKSDEEVVRELEENGIRIIYKPMVLVPDTFESLMLLGGKSFGTIEMDIHETLNKIKIRKRNDPFS